MSGYGEARQTDSRVRELLAAYGDEPLLRGTDLAGHRRRQSKPEPLATTLDPVDDLLDGGLPRGALTEVIGRSSCGRFATLLAALQQVTTAGEPAALIDQGDQLDPQVAAAAGVDLERLLWLRPRNLVDTVAAAELLTSTGFGLVAVDLGLPPVRGRTTPAAWIRLARRAAEHEAVVVVGTPYRLSGCAATAVLKAFGTRGRWLGARGGPRLLEGLTSHLALHRHRNHRADRSARLRLRLPEAAFGPSPEQLHDTIPIQEVAHATV